MDILKTCMSVVDGARINFDRIKPFKLSILAYFAQ